MTERPMGLEASCPTDEALAGLLLEDLETAERRALAEHVISCRACGDAFRTLSALHTAAGSSARRNTSRRAWIGLAAGLFVAVAVAFWWPSGPSPTGAPDALRAGEETLEVSPEDGATLVEAPRELSWPGEEGPWRVRIFDAEGQELWASTPVWQPRIGLPAGVRQSLGSGAFFWIVSAGERDVPDGGAETLGPFWLILGPET